MAARHAGVEVHVNHVERSLDGFRRAALTPSHWTAALDGIAAAFESDGATLVLGPTTIESLATSSNVVPLLPQYLSGDVFDPREQRVTPRLDEEFMPDHAYFSPREIAREPYYQDFLRANGFGWNATAVLHPGLMLSVKRAFARGPYEGDVLGRLNAALPQLRAASRVAVHSWHRYFDGELAAFDTMHRGAILLDSKARVLKVNECVRFGDGLDVIDGALRAAHPADRSRLQNFLRELVGGHATGAASLDLQRPAKGRPLLLDGLVSREALRSLHSDAVAIVLVTDLDRPVQASGERLRRLFGLTATECAVTCALMAGLSLSELAVRLSISEGHARKRLQSVYAKTGTSRQGELIVLVAKLGLT